MSLIRKPNRRKTGVQYSILTDQGMYGESRSGRQSALNVAGAVAAQFPWIKVIKSEGSGQPETIAEWSNGKRIT